MASTTSEKPAKPTVLWRMNPHNPRACTTKFNAFNACRHERIEVAPDGKSARCPKCDFEWSQL